MPLMNEPENLINIVKSGGDYLYFIGHLDPLEYPMAMPKLHSILRDKGGAPRKGTLILDFDGATLEFETPFFERSGVIEDQTLIIANPNAFDWVMQEFEKLFTKCPSCGHILDG